jgi:glutamate N-acetyltransferase/amino-acid N-acetyltransferase
MLCFVQTDAIVADPAAALRDAVAGSFERITVDGQMSTNDTVLLQLALEIVADGEGASRVGRIEVIGAADEAEAEVAARAVANSPLVKTALYGHDPNWGRIAQAAGQALAGEDLAELGSGQIDVAEVGSDLAEAELALDLRRGAGRAHVFFSDLTHEYIEINAEYTT